MVNDKRFSDTSKNKAVLGKLSNEFKLQDNTYVTFRHFVLVKYKNHIVNIHIFTFSSKPYLSRSKIFHINIINNIMNRSCT